MRRSAYSWRAEKTPYPGTSSRFLVPLPGPYAYSTRQAKGNLYYATQLRDLANLGITDWDGCHSILLDPRGMVCVCNYLIYNHLSWMAKTLAAMKASGTGPQIGKLLWTAS